MSGADIEVPRSRKFKLELEAWKIEKILQALAAEPFILMGEIKDQVGRQSRRPSKASKQGDADLKEKDNGRRSLRQHMES